MARSWMTGVTNITATLKQLQQKMPDEVKSALYIEASIEKTEAVKRTPWEFGTLRASARVWVERTGRRLMAHISFGGPAAPYAIYVHEDLDANHPRGGQAKFLESTLNESRPYILARVVRRLKTMRWR